jgi:hypothetical protein
MEVWRVDNAEVIQAINFSTVDFLPSHHHLNPSLDLTFHTVSDQHSLSDVNVVQIIGNTRGVEKNSWERPTKIAHKVWSDDVETPHNMLTDSHTYMFRSMPSSDI